MRKTRSFLIIFFISFSILRAKGIFVIPGVRAATIGGAYVGIADDLYAIYWNPAGLTSLEGINTETSVFYAVPTAKSNTGLGNSSGSGDDFPIPDLFLLSGTSGVEPSLYDSKKLKISSIIPFLAAGTQLNDISLAAGFYGSGGGKGSWEDTVSGALVASDTIDASIDSIYGFLITNISAAKNLSEKLSFGLGVNYIYMFDSKEVEKTYTKSAVSPMPAGYGILIDQNSTGSGVEVTAGLMYSPSDKWKTGFIFRSGAVIELEGTAKLDGSGAAAAYTTETDYSETYNYPMTYGLGISCQVTEKLLIAAGIDINNYSAMEKDVDYETESLFFTDSDAVDMKWNNTTQIRVGAEYATSDKLVLRCGLYTDPAPFGTDNTLTLLNTNQYTLTAFTLGAGYDISDDTSIDANIGYTISDKPEKSGREYEFSTLSTRLGLSYSF